MDLPAPMLSMRYQHGVNKSKDFKATERVHGPSKGKSFLSKHSKSKHID